MAAISNIRLATGRSSLPCRCAAALLVATLLLQILPFTFTAAPPGCGSGGFAQYIEPLPVCGEETAFGGLLADHTWLPAPGAPVVVDAPDAAVTLPPFVPPPAGPTRRPFRPPRA